MYLTQYFRRVRILLSVSLYTALCCTFTLQGLLWPVSDVSVKTQIMYYLCTKS